MTMPDYKNTVRLPQTAFPMKGNLPTKEPEILKSWEDKKVYQQLQKKNSGKKKFVMPDGPPYANGSIHIGHALNKNLKDIILKYKAMAGFESPFIPGWDCHGLPIEHEVMKKLGPKAKELSDSELRKLCREEAQKWVNHQREQFKRLGVLADWENPYLTMDPAYEAEEVREFARAFKAGTVYSGTKPVYWNYVLKTALADAEVEYHMHKSHAIYVKFNITDPATLKKLGNPSKKTSVVIWTTTPWTLPANLAIALNAEFDYSVFDAGNENLVIAQKLKESFEKDTGLSLKEGFSFKGSELDRCQAQHPFIDRKSLIILGDHVSAEAGTGAVHTAPGHGADDYKVGLKYDLPILSPVDEGGCYTDEFPEMKGTHIVKANPMIVEKLKNSGHLLGHKEIEHSYPHCWRTKVPLIFRATPQWFIGIDDNKTKVREKTLKAIKDIKFFPDWGEARLTAMMENRPDWCVSRQRVWGVPIPIFYKEGSGEPLADYDVMMKVADAIENEGGIEAYYKHDPEHFIGKKGYRHGKDILDVWFDSGICHAAVQKKRAGMDFPADIYLEGSDQHRGWFNTSLLSSMVTNGVPPFKALITHGFVNDSQGMKMSKSKGNSVDPNEVSKKSGAEIIRLWAIYEDYGQDLTCGQQELERVTETYRRIRNTMRFLLGATFDFDPQLDSVPYEKMTAIDQWALDRLAYLTEKVTEAYNEYSFYKVYHLLNNFFTVDLSATYLDILKDRLYTWKADGLPRRSSQTVLFIMTDYLVRMMAPVLTFLAEETYSYMKGNKKDSALLLDFPTVPQSWKNSALESQFEELLRIRTMAQKELENLRSQKIIGSSLEGHLSISAEGKTYDVLSSFKDLKEFLIVSSLDLQKGPEKVQAQKAEGEKCVRCWVYSTDTGKNANFPGVCPKCVEALS